jgi:hypothetical protein
MTRSSPEPAATRYAQWAEGRRAQGTAAGTPGLILRVEAALVLAAAVCAYARYGQGWPLFAVLFLTPDLSMLGYLAGRQAGAFAYNLGHSYVLPAALVGWSLWAGSSLALSLGLIWIAHIGFDRMLGYGLKYATGFGHTHLGLVGKMRG